jgi:hypothetical protein
VESIEVRIVRRRVGSKRAGASARSLRVVKPAGFGPPMHIHVDAVRAGPLEAREARAERVGWVARGLFVTVPAENLMRGLRSRR